MNVFGPVPSRRLGFSLGVDIIPPKYCTFDCIYCQIGRTATKGTERRSFYDPDAIVEQVKEKAGEEGRIDHVTLSGSGEPTLNADIGRIIRRLKEEIALPIAVITNGSLLWRADVRRDIAAADVVLPSLDGPDQAILERINRPHPSVRIEQVVEGLRSFRREYTGRLWLEIMLIKNINSDRHVIESLGELLPGINPDKVQLNTVTRPPADASARPLGQARLAAIARRLGGTCEVIAAFERRQSAVDNNWSASVLATLKRRSLTLDDIVRTTGLTLPEARQGLKQLVQQKRVRAVTFDKRRYFTVIE
jgi:wyosine [tRNA(Phe)-imidazoG37] synthetase (radical SAM superfamily)